MPVVLIVDDEYGVAEMTAELLSLQGHRVATAINGKLALEAIGELRPDVMLVDLMMPVMSGDDLVRRLKQDPALFEIPIVMMSAAGFDALDADLPPLIAGFLRKPFTFDEVNAALERALR